MFCKVCNKELPEGQRSKYCGAPCRWRDMKRGQRREFPVTCPDCLETRQSFITPYRHKKNNGESRCSACREAKFASLCGDGSDNPNWKGGAKNWSKGRHGRDKDGLSWKIQRKQAWERDSYTCQHCGVKPKRNPDVHHISPWLTSQSHTLDNLICLCQSCHLKEEAKVQENWGGQLVDNYPQYQTCSRCGNRSEGDICYKCKQQLKVKRPPIPLDTQREIAFLRHKGETIQSLMTTFGVSQRSVYNYCHRYPKE